VVGYRREGREEDCIESQDLQRTAVLEEMDKEKKKKKKKRRRKKKKKKKTLL